MTNGDISLNISCYYSVFLFTSSFYIISILDIDYGAGKKYMGARLDFTPEMHKRALENQKPLKILIDCNVKVYECWRF